MFFDRIEEVKKFDGHFVHTDLVPHNFRIVDGVLYFLDLNAFSIANLFEGWARLLNYFTLYDQDLELELLSELKESYREDAMRGLHAMRLYKLSFLVNFYSRSLPQTNGMLRTLTSKRLEFWVGVLQNLIAYRTIGRELADQFVAIQESLRSDHERLRQARL